MSAEIVAHKLEGKENAYALVDWIKRSCLNTKNKPEVTYDGKYIKIFNQRQGNAPDVMVGTGDWVIKNEKNTFFGCSDSQFLKNYEPVPPKDLTLSK